MTKSHPVTVYLDDQQKIELTQQAAAMGMSLSAYLRWRVANGVQFTSSHNDATGNVSYSYTVNSSVANREVK